MPRQSVRPAPRQATAASRCLTCKERKIKCDATLPVCRNCQKAHRECRAGHAFELSWPTPGSRRAMSAPHSKSSSYAVSLDGARQCATSYYFVNVQSNHIAAHLLLPCVDSSQGTRSTFFQRQHPQGYPLRLLPKQAPSLYADAARLQKDSSGLVSYFYYEASNSLPQLDREPAQFRDLLLRMSVQDNSASSRAVLYSLFCLSALRRYGNVQESAHFRDLALLSLQQAANIEGFGPANILQHMAASLLLCRAEISLGDESSIFWALYVCNLSSLCSFAFDDPLCAPGFPSSDASCLYPYIHYHLTIAQFSVTHWQMPSELVRQLTMRFKGKTILFKCRKRVEPFYYLQGRGDYLQHEIILLDLVLKTSKDEQMDPAYPRGWGHEQSVSSLETQLQEALLDSEAACAGIRAIADGDEPAAADAGLKLQRYFFLAATWIYFQRTCRHLTGPSLRIDALFDAAFSWSDDIQRLDVRIVPFALFLLGTEANTEARRLAVMELIHRRPELLPIPSDVLARCGGSAMPPQIDSLLAAAWAQDDLHDNAEGYLDYVTKMQYVITARSVLPALV